MWQRGQRTSGWGRWKKECEEKPRTENILDTGVTRREQRDGEEIPTPRYGRRGEIRYGKDLDTGVIKRVRERRKQRVRQSHRKPDSSISAVRLYTVI